MSADQTHTGQSAASDPRKQTRVLVVDDDANIVDWLLERRRRRAERALTVAVAACYLLGVSTRRMEKLVESLGIIRRSKSQVPTIASELDAHVSDFHTHPLDQGPYTFVAADAP